MSESHSSEPIQASGPSSEPGSQPSEHGSAASGFSPAEATAMHADDVAAAGHITKLMVAIFLGGVLLYSIVALICSRGA